MKKLVAILLTIAPILTYAQYNTDFKGTINATGYFLNGVSFTGGGGGSSVIPFQGITPGNGNGIRFWNDDAYKIHMGSGAEYFYGPVQDYSIKMNMSGGTPNRGWTWGVNGETPVAAINTLGKMQIAGSFTTGGNIVLPSSSGNKQIYTWGDGDNNWRIGMSASPGFTRDLTNQHVEYLTYGPGVGQGFAVGVNNGQSSFEVHGADHTAFFRGKVGIGTISPDAKLTVKGNIHTNEVKVDLLGAVAPDYVFEKDYSLMSLTELKAYIEANKHLPEVPSAKEIETNGLQLGEMNLLLLKKVEELTLHMIELKQMNIDLKARVEKIESKK